MEEHDRLLELLRQKETILRTCAQITWEITIQPTPMLYGLVTRRQALLEQTQTLDLEIRALCVGDGAARAAVNHTSARGDLAEDAAALYDASLAVKAAARHVQRGEEAARLRLESERSAALEQLETMNRSGSAVAGKYSWSIQTGVRHPFPAAREKKA